MAQPLAVLWDASGDTLKKARNVPLASGELKNKGPPEGMIHRSFNYTRRIIFWGGPKYGKVGWLRVALVAGMVPPTHIQFDVWGY